MKITVNCTTNVLYPETLACTWAGISRAIVRVRKLESNNIKGPGCVNYTVIYLCHWASQPMLLIPFVGLGFMPYFLPCPGIRRTPGTTHESAIPIMAPHNYATSCLRVVRPESSTQTLTINKYTTKHPHGNLVPTIVLELIAFSLGYLWYCLSGH